ncbi:MAG: hypothetical protein LBC86_01560 [Oscillospiraceae bacterium]|jgi:hypothetical protein|nr:hypothetical protein [Oscillospiraceae bacterium]
MLYAEFNFDEYVAAEKEASLLEGIVKTAIAMLQEGLKPETVAKCTKLPLERVQQLQPQ